MRYCSLSPHLIYMMSVALRTPDLQRKMKFLHTLKQLIDSSPSRYQLVLLRKHTAIIFQSSALILYNMFTYSVISNRMYITDKIFCRILNLTINFGCVSDMLNMYYYKTFRYREALFVIKMTKVN